MMQQRRNEIAGNWGGAAVLARELCVLLFLLLGAGALGYAVVTLAALEVKWLALVFLALCAALGAALCWSLRWPLAPILRIALLASFSFRLEINLFQIQKYNAGPVGINISLMLILSLLLMGLHVGERLRGEVRAPVWPLGCTLLAWLLWLWCAVAVLNSREQTLGVYALWELGAELLLCFVVAAQFAERTALRAAVIVLSAGVGLSGLIGLLQFTTGAFTDWTLLGAVKEESHRAIGGGEISRVAGLLTKPNAFAWYLVALLPVPLAALVLRAPELDGWRRVLLAAAAGLGAVSLILTYARGGWMSFVLSLLLLAALAFRLLPWAERWRFALRLGLAGVLALLLCLPFAGGIYTRLTEDDRGAAYVRVPLMEVAWAMIGACPWLGVGPANYEAEMRRYDRTTEGVTDGFDWPVHNIFLHMTAEGGIPAALCWLALVALALRRGWQALRGNDPLLQVLALGLFVGLLAWLFTGLKELGSFGGGGLRLCFLYCGLLLAVDRVRRGDEELRLSDS